MAAGGDFYTRVGHPTEFNEALERLSRLGGASLVLEREPPTPLPVLLDVRASDAPLHVDISAMRDTPQADSIRDGEGFRIVGQDAQGVLRTSVLIANCVWTDDRLYCRCPLPSFFEKLQRRVSFRAQLREWMTVGVDVHANGSSATGVLRDLSLNGCLVELETTGALLGPRATPLQLTMTFPDGSRFSTLGRPHHETRVDDRILCGFRFEVTAPDREQALWRLVCEIEREAARHALSGRTHLRPSSRFSGSTLD